MAGLKKLSDLLPTMPDYDHIELTEAELKAAIFDAKQRKARYLEEQRIIEEEKKRVAELRLPWTTDELMLYFEERVKTLPFRFVIDKHNHDVIQLLALYFSNNPEFENAGIETPNGFMNYSLNKGILIQSHTRGTGKTVLMDLFSINRRHCFKVISTKKISGFFQQSGEKVIDNFSKPWEAQPMEPYFLQSPIGICFDDIGDEQIKNHYGNRENVMAQVLGRIYDDNQEKGVFKFFHGTTNITGDEIEERYDARIRSRMREMFNFIQLPGDDRRR